MSSIFSSLEVPPLRPENRAEKRGFTSYKCPQPIVYTRRCVRDALIQSTLDPKIASMYPLRGWQSGTKDCFFTFSVRLGGKSLAFAICETTQGLLPSFPPGADAALAIARSSILAEPVLGTARMVWSHRHHAVPPASSMTLLRRLKDAPEGLGLLELTQRLSDEPERSVKLVLAMACQGLVSFDLGKPITDEIPIFLGPAAK